MFVERKKGKIVGLFANKQPYATEFIADDSAEVNQYLKKKGEYKESYDALRAKAYPNIGDQLDAIWKQIEEIKQAGGKVHADTQTVLDEVNQVKLDYPKK